MRQNGGCGSGGSGGGEGGGGGGVLVHKNFFDGDTRSSTNFNYPKNRMIKNSNPH